MRNGLNHHVRNPLAAAGIVDEDQDLLQALLDKVRVLGYRVRWRARGSIAVGGPRPQLELELVGLVLAVVVGQLARAGG